MNPRKAIAALSSSIATWQPCAQRWHVACMAISLNLKHKLSVVAIVQCLLHGDAIPGVVIEASGVYLGMCGELPRPF